ncbi:LysR family transcriptional regulator [Pseudomonas guariconensis]|uniref:LysR family transcriptional regulator n=1 Tax=Pseudomonas guariconensis TaxID=1288410 RepID=UPI002D1ECBEF|nr:LysR family transcriptional regulator [Pseudomonas guariconensis]MEB3839826.1 LysR family transcriptional regulator [Pseudomonas guariconensis]MEB3872694.1 LysR family transcriptional regulator [Pseudomonas guariconensis]MEB3878291.1 LysR family transcriptional regulator [Pseudomonas guariconensis]MEB3894981.1 LysR family transcriptional regulator [Pseudomonas guariconensis]
MDIRFLESLVAVIETGSIAAAARRENLTAPAISQRIQALEKSLCCELLNRGSHSVDPSEQCLALLPKMRNLIQCATELRDGFDSNGLTGDFKLGAISTALTGLLPELMHQLTITAPHLRLRITPGDSRALYEQVVTGELDAGLMVCPPFSVPKSIKMQTLRHEPLMLLTKEPIEQSNINTSILTHPLIRYDSNAWGGQIALQYLHDNDLSPDLLCNLDALDAIYIMVEKGMGVSLVPAWAGLKSGEVFATPVSDSDDYIRQLVLLYKSIPRRPKALDAIKEILKRTAL